MMSKIEIPKDVAVLCEQIAKGHARRKKSYENKRLDIIYSGAASGSFADRVGGAKGSGVSDPNAVKAERLERLESSLDAHFVKAVEQALLMLGADVSQESQKRLRKAVLINCENGKEYPFEFLGLDEFSRRDFYRRRKRFIIGIGAELGLIDGYGV